MYKNDCVNFQLFSMEEATRLRDMVYENVKYTYTCESYNDNNDNFRPCIYFTPIGKVTNYVVVAFYGNHVTFEFLNSDKYVYNFDVNLSDLEKIEFISKKLKLHIRGKNCSGAKYYPDILRNLHERVELLESLWLHERVSGLERRMASRL